MQICEMILIHEFMKSRAFWNFNLTTLQTCKTLSLRFQNIHYPVSRKWLANVPSVSLWIVAFPVGKPSPGHEAFLTRCYTWKFCNNPGRYLVVHGHPHWYFGERQKYKETKRKIKKSKRWSPVPGSDSEMAKTEWKFRWA